MKNEILNEEGGEARRQAASGGSRPSARGKKRTQASALQSQVRFLKSSATLGFEDDDEDEDEDEKDDEDEDAPTTRCGVQDDDEERVESPGADGRPYFETTAGLALGGVWLFSLSVTRMNTWHKLVLTLVATITWAAGSFTAVAASAKWEPQKGETIVVLGNTFGERMEMFGFFEAALHARYPDHKLRVRSMSWSADEISLQPRPYLFGELKDKLSPPKENVDPKEVWFNGVGADALILCFGMNESFKGEGGLAKFRTDLDAYLKNHLAQRYNGKAAPRVLLVSPIAHENLGKPLPDGAQHNKDLAKYVKAMEETAAANNVPFIDLFNPHLAWMKKNPKEKLTFNGIHQTEYGDWVISQWMAEQLGWYDGKPAGNGAKVAADFRDLLAFKNDRFWIHFRAVNGEYIYGRRRQIWAQKVPMVTDPEMLRLWQVDEDADKLVFQAKKPMVAQVWAEKPAGK